jgi:ferredoxin
MDAAAYIGCGACVAACPKEISLDVIAQLNRDLIKATVAPA